MSAADLEEGYWSAYRDFYRWHSIARGAMAHRDPVAALRHMAYAAGWKKFEPLWDLLIRLKRAGEALPVLERVLDAARGDDEKAVRPPVPREAGLRPAPATVSTAGP
jgi:hypothetical protein